MDTTTITKLFFLISLAIILFFYDKYKEKKKYNGLSEKTKRLVENDDIKWSKTKPSNAQCWDYDKEYGIWIFDEDCGL